MKQLGLLSKKLATILLDCPVTFNEKDYELNHPDFEKVNEILKEHSKSQKDKIVNYVNNDPKRFADRYPEAMLNRSPLYGSILHSTNLYILQA